MRGFALPAVKAVAAAVCLAGLAACGQMPTVDQASTRSPLTSGGVEASQIGDTTVRIAAGATYSVDDAGLLEVRVTVHSTAHVVETAAIRGTLFDAQGTAIATVTGGSAPIPPGADQQVELTGEPPVGTIARAEFAVQVSPASTP